MVGQRWQPQLKRRNEPANRWARRPFEWGTPVQPAAAAARIEDKKAPLARGFVLRRACEI